MTPAEYIRSVLRALNTDNAREILAHITRPEQVAIQTSEQRVKDPERVAWEASVVADLSAMFKACTGNGENAVARTRLLGTTANMISAASAAKTHFPERSEEIDRLSLRCSAHYIQFVADGGMGMIPDHFGQAFYVEPVTRYTDGPSQWDALFPGQPAPTMAEVAAMMTEPEET